MRDFQDMAAAMAQSFKASDALANRGPDSPPWVISIDKVTNLTSDVLTSSEQWAVMAMIRGAQPIQVLQQQMNVSFVLPPERVQQLRQNMPEFAPGSPGSPGSGFGENRHVTHTMTATFRSATRATGHARTDLYYCEFQLIPLGGGAPVWTDRFEFKRQAFGQIWD